MGKCLPVGCYGEDEFRFGKLTIVQVGEDAELRSGGEVVAVVASIDAGDLGRDDFFAL